MGGERELLLAKLRDAVRTARRRPCFLGFLDESQAAFCREALRREPGEYLLVKEVVDLDDCSAGRHIGARFTVEKE